MGKKNNVYLTMLKESLIDFSKMTVNRGPAADVLDYTGKDELDFYKPTSDVVSILERFYVKEGIIDSDDTTLATGDAAGRDKSVENSEWQEQDLVDIATKKGNGQSAEAGSLPNGTQPDGYNDNLMDQDDSVENKETADDFGVKPVTESSLFEEFRDMMLMNENASMVDTTADETVPQGGTDVQVGDYEAKAPGLGNPEEYEDDFEVPLNMNQVSQGTMEENLEEALFEMDEEDEDDEDEDEGPGGLEPDEDEVGGTPVMPGDDSVGQDEDEDSDTTVPPVGDEEDQDEEMDVTDEMYEMLGEDDDFMAEADDLFEEGDMDVSDSDVDADDQFADDEDEGDDDEGDMGGQEEALENFVEEADEFLFEDDEDFDGGQDFFLEATEEAEPVASEKSAKTDGLFGGKDEGIDDSDKASSWQENLDEMVELFEDTDTEDTAPGRAGNELSNGENHETDLGPDAGGGDQLEGGYQEEGDLFEDAMLEADEPDMNSEPAEIKSGPSGGNTLPNEEPKPEENQPAEITNEGIILKRKNAEEAIVERLLREFETIDPYDAGDLDSVDLDDDGFDD